MDIGNVVSPSQSWSDGGTSHVLPKERSKATFSVEKMTHILDGGEDYTRKRRWIQNSHEDAFEDPKRTGRVHDDSDTNRSEVAAKSITHFMNIHWKHLKRGYRPKGQDMTFMSGAKFGLTGPLSLHYGVFMSTLRSQTSAEQREWWLDAANRLAFIGCYAQTELGKGSNVRGIQTTATFVEGGGRDGDGEWILHTPTLQSMKWWSTGLYSATHAAVYAQMILKGKRRGVHVFFVQLRGPDLLPLPGVEMGDIGRKLGDNDTPIGYLRLNCVKIPRRHLMEARAHVTSSGMYVSGPPSRGGENPARNGTEGRGEVHRQNKAGEDGKRSNRASNNKKHYITMLKTRIGLTNTAGSALAKAATIAVRYSAVRHQGFKVGYGLNMDDPENQILDYQNQLFRCLQWTSTAYAIKFVARWLLRKRKTMEQNMKSGRGVLDLPEVHASAAGLKALCCCMAADGIEDLRRACGGHGYLMSSGIAPLESDFKGPNTTAEGDYVVLALQTARFLIKSVKSSRTGNELPGTTAILAPLRGGKAIDLRTFRPKAPSNLSTLLCKTDDASFASTRTYLSRLFAYRSLVKCANMMSNYEHSEMTAKQKGIADVKGFAREQNARLMQTAALAHVRYFILSKLFEEISNNVSAESDRERSVLRQLASFYAISEITSLSGGSGVPSWGGILTSYECDSFERASDELLKILRPNCVALVEAFDFSDTVLNSALGSSDGKVYERLYDAARGCAMNVEDAGGVPSCLRAAEPFLDLGFLKSGKDTKTEGGVRGNGGGGASVRSRL